MTFEEVLKRTLFRWWLVVIIVVGFTIGFYNWSSSQTYQASIGIGISFNNPEFLNNKSGDIAANPAGNLGPEYTYSLEEFTKYLAFRFASPEVQAKVSKDAGLGIQSFDPKQPFYKVNQQSGGYISVTFDAVDKDTADKFIQSIKKIYVELIEVERSSGELEAFKIEPKEKFIEDVSTISRPTQFRILPSIAGFLVGLTLAVLLPFKKF